MTARDRRGPPDLPPGPATDLLDLFRQLRHASGMTNGQLAVKTALSRSHVSEVFSGWKAPSPAAAATIAQALGANPAEVRRAHGLAERIAELNRYQRATRRAATTPVSGLPGPDRYFTGRDRELAALTAIADGGGCVVSGMAGVGKTALVVRAATALAPRFPDGTVFLDLHGHTTGQPPLTVADALDRLLRRLGVAGDNIPDAVDERVALYRTVLADRRLLLVLDNARDAAQVRPLLPGASRCAAIVTSRLRLTALDTAVAVPLDVLDPAEAVALFRSLVGPDRLGTDPADPTPQRICERCGWLPLAIRIAAGRLRARPLATPEELADRLSRAHEALSELDDGDRSVAASFQVSVTDLPAGLRHAFALLAQNPGADVDVFSAAALLGVSRAGADHALDRLAERHLLVEHARGRYRFHDLIAVFARQHLDPPVAAGDRLTALRRLVDHLLRTAETADRLVTPHRFRVPLTLLAEPAAAPPLRDYDAALAWLTAEQANLTDACLAAGAAGLDVACWQLAYTLRGYFFLAKEWQPWLATHRAAVAAARRCADPYAEALSLNNLGLAHFELGRHDRADDCYQAAHRLFRQAGDPSGANTARANRAWVLFVTGRYAEFLRRMEPVLAAYRRAGEERNAAITQRGLGLAKAALGDTAEAIADLLAAMAVFRALDLRLDIAMTLNALGDAYHHAGEADRAATAYTDALAASERCGSAFERARAHDALGGLAAAADRWATARAHWAEAYAGYRRLGAPQADRVRALAFPQWQP